MDPLTPAMAAKWEKTRKKGRLKFSLNYGLTGLCGALMAEFYNAEMLGNRNHLPVFFFVALDGFAVLLGFFAAWFVWPTQEKRYAEFKQREADDKITPKVS